MKKLLLILLSLIFALNISSTPVKIESSIKNITYNDSVYNGSHIRVNYDTNEIFLNIKNFENKTFKFKKFLTMPNNNYIINWTTAVCENENYDIQLIYVIRTKYTYYIFINKRTGYKLEYHFV